MSGLYSGADVPAERDLQVASAGEGEGGGDFNSDGEAAGTPRATVRSATVSVSSRRSEAMAEGPVAARGSGKPVEMFRAVRAGGRAAAGASHTAALRENPKGISAISPALDDDLPRRSETKAGVGLRWVDKSNGTSPGKGAP